MTTPMRRRTQIRRRIGMLGGPGSHLPRSRAFPARQDGKNAARPRWSRYALVTESPKALRRVDMRGTRKLMAVAAGCVLAVSLAACGGGDEEPAAEDVTPSEAPSDALDVEIDEAIEVIPACTSYFALDLKLSEINSEPDAKKKAKKEMLAELKGLTDTLVTDAEEAYISGDLPERVLVNSNRIQKNLSRVEASEGTDGIKKKQMRRIERSASRIERSCEAAGDMLPQENLDARTA